MATTYLSGTTTVAQTLATGEEYFVTSTGHLNATNSAISLAAATSSAVAIGVEGSVSSLAADAISLVNTGPTGLDFDLTVGKSGSVSAISSSSNGVNISATNGMTASIRNSGEISGESIGIKVLSNSISGPMIINSGNVFGGTNSILLDARGTTLHNTGLLSGTLDVTESDFFLANSGQIGSLSDNAINLTARTGKESVFTLQNSGSIQSLSGSGINITPSSSFFHCTATITNYGTIEGKANGVLFGDSSQSADTLNLANFGSIRGGDSAALDINSDTATIVNSKTGTISNFTTDAISTTANLTLINDGKIETQSVVFSSAIFIDSSGSNITNRGEISGIANAISSTGASSSDTLKNTGLISGQVNYGAGTVSIENSGTIESAVFMGGGADRYLARGTGNAAAGVNGDAGNDTLTGALADDVFAGGADNDTLTGAAGDDSLDGGTGNDSLRGDAGDDSLSGDVGDDVLTAGTGDDVIDGGTGRDTLTGGAGADVFVFNQTIEEISLIVTLDSGKTTATADIIRDFQHGVDDIDLSELMDSNAVFNGAKGLKGGGVDSVTYNPKTGLLLADFDGNKTADFALVLANNAVLTSGDFLF